MLSSIEFVRLSAVMMVVTLLISSCSGSSESVSGEDQSGSESLANEVESVSEESEPPVVASVLVNFEITVPTYMPSDELQVRLSWGDIDTTANWVRDESWVVSETLAANTENLLAVTFADGNGEIVLASFEGTFKSGPGDIENVQITADQFDAEQWDNDSDGVSNLDEMVAGNNPDGDDVPQAVQVSLALVPDKTFRFTWQPSNNAAYYRVLENADGISGFTQISNDIDSAVLQYDHRVALYRRINASYIVQACNSRSCVDSSVITVPESLSEAVGYFKATTDEPKGFGARVAISADASTIAVAGIGVVYVFGQVNGMWQQQASLDYVPKFDRLLAGLSFSGNGDVLVIGIPLEELLRADDEEWQPSDGGAGAVYVYHRENGQWASPERLVSNNIAGSHAFGTSVAVSTDGSTLAVSAPLARFVIDGEIQRGGAVYLFEQSNGTWQQQSYLLGEEGEFGSSLAFGHNGSVLAVGAERHERSGSAYVYTKIGTGWELQAFIKADDADVDDEFGASIAIDATGSTLAVGAPFFNYGNSRLTGPIGAAYVFRNIDGNWQQETRVNGIGQGDAFASAIVLSGDGNTLMAGAQGVTNNFIGLVKVYVRDNDTWFEQPSLTASNADQSDEFGSALGLSNDGETLIVGASNEKSAAQGINGDQNDNSGGNTGAAYLF